MIPDGLVRELMEQFGVPGVVVGIVRDDSKEVAGFGVTSSANPLPVDDGTLFQIGSITKTYTATAAMRLVEAGKLDLDEPARTYLPDLRMSDKVVTNSVTMRHLLSHTGGFAGDHFLGSIGRGEDALARIVATLDQLEQLTPLGEVWAYNNAGFYIAGRIIEVITGKPYEDALHELVLEPLGLDNSFFYADEVITKRFAVGHDRTGAVLTPWSIGRATNAAGGLITTAHELLRYARMQWEPKGLLSDASIEEMRRPHADTGGLPGDAVGIGWYRFERDGRVFVMHQGATVGQVAQLVICPSERFALVIFTNHDDGGALAAGVVADVLRTEFSVESPEDELLERTPAELGEYVGSYDAQEDAVKLALSDGALVLEVHGKGGFPEPGTPAPPNPPPTRLAFTAPDTVIALDQSLKGVRAEFLRDSAGAIAWFRIFGRLHRPI